jgi:hypothetical protein
VEKADVTTIENMGREDPDGGVELPQREAGIDLGGTIVSSALPRHKITPQVLSVAAESSRLRREARRACSDSRLAKRQVGIYPIGYGGVLRL